MAAYLRDQNVRNVSIDAESLGQINYVFFERFQELNRELEKSNKKAFFTYIIRFDNKGYRVFSFDELIAYFNMASDVERILFTIESDEALASGRRTGAYMEVCLDNKEPARCTLTSSSDDKGWAEASFAAMEDVLQKFKTRYGLARAQWVRLAIQIFGVAIIFVVSLWLASKVAPKLKVDNAFVISFLFILLMLSNVWSFLNGALLFFISRSFPNVEFIRPAKARLHWIVQSIVGSAAFAITLYVLGQGFSFLTDVIVGFAGKGT
ncbi:hypothetical protein [Burkholderia sp. Tr-20390]|uniref:hypothetical protein n=1 Tax=Burkholderia sp. Tr-20390 TaxID=2703904 RepID=UPI00197D66F2|nr:hypothetical protein [Burkholderia sp. Tr-20390]MBN3730910.1 hypothetical protein [Burkholderia sp. Tr-20390]